MKKFLALGFLTTLFFSSCSKNFAPFTKNLYEVNEWNEAELKQIQFYLSDDVLISREIAEINSEIISGEIKMVSGKQVEEVLIKKGTPGVLMGVSDKNRFSISFEEGSDSQFLLFGPNPKVDDRYALMSKDWSGRIGKVIYNDQTYYIRPESAASFLMVDLKQINKQSVRKRTAKGRKIR